MNIYEKLATVQQELIAPKNQYNSFGKYNYRSCEDILEGLKPCLKKVNAAVTITDEVLCIGERYYVKATAYFIDCEADCRISNSAFAREEETKKGMDASQITGATSSYARKYALNGLFCIDDVKDADTRDNRLNEAKTQAEAEAKQKELENALIGTVKIKALEARCKKEGVALETIFRLYKIKALSELTEKKYMNIHEHWEEIKKA